MNKIDKYDALISVIDLRKYFDIETSTDFMLKLGQALPTTTIETQYGYFSTRSGRFAMRTARMVHVKLSDIYARAQTLLQGGALGGQVNSQAWEKLLDFTISEFTDNIRTQKLCK